MAASIVWNKVDEDRFTMLMEQTYRKVFNMAYRLSGSRSDAEDLTQEAFFRAYRSFSDYDGTKPFENWIFRIVTRLFLDLLRHRRRRVTAVSFDTPLNGAPGEDAVRYEVPDESLCPEAALLDRTLSEDLERALASLSPEQRLLITLADIEQLPYKDIAEILGRPVGTIRSRLHRAHKALRVKIEGYRAARAQRAGSLTPCPNPA